MLRRRLLMQKGELYLSWETLNVDASSHSINLYVYYNGKDLPGMPVSYLTSSGISVYNYYRYLEINVDPNYNTSDVTKSITITYNGVSKTAYIYLSGDEEDYTENIKVVTGVSGECEDGDASSTEGVDFAYSYSGSCSGTIDVETTETTYWISGDVTTGSSYTSSYPIRSADISISGYCSGDQDIVDSASISLTDSYGDSYDFYLSEDTRGSTTYIRNIPFRSSDGSDDIFSGDLDYNSGTGRGTFCF